MIRYRIIGRVYTGTTATSYTIYDSSDMSSARATLRPSMKLSLDDAGTLDFTVTPAHPNYNVIKNQGLRMFVQALRDNEKLFDGRVLSVERKIDNQLSFTCEGALNFLMDSDMPKATYTETAQAFLRRCLLAHNAAMGNESWKKFQIGTVNVAKAGSGTHTFEINNYTTIKSLLDSQLVGRFGGFIRLRLNSGITYVDYLDDYGRTCAQSVKIGTNIEDKNDSMSRESLFTIMRPLGKTGDNETADVTLNGYTPPSGAIPSGITKNGGVLELTEFISLYGRIYHTEQFETATTQAELLTKALEFIARRGGMVPSSSEISFVDWSILNGNSDRVLLGDKFTTIENYKNVKMTVAEITIDMEDPANDSMILKNDDELHANSLESYATSPDRAASGTGAGSSLTDKVASNTSAKEHTHLHIRETTDTLELFAKDINVNSEHLEAYSNTMFLAVKEVEGHQGEFVVTGFKGPGEGHPTTEFKLTGDGISIKATDPDHPFDDLNWDVGSSSSITQEHDRISMVVRNTGVSDTTAASQTLSARIDVEAGRISNKVEKGDVSTELAIECGNVTISGGNLTVSGYITSSMLESALQSASIVSTQSLRATDSFRFQGQNITFHNKQMPDGSYITYLGTL